MEEITITKDYLMLNIMGAVDKAREKLTKGDPMMGMLVTVFGSAIICELSKKLFDDESEEE